MVPTAIKVPLYKHQMEGIVQHINKRDGFANFCEQGTGKTIMAIAAMNLIAQHVLIICPNGLKFTWRNEIESKSELPWESFIPLGSTKLINKMALQFLAKKAERKVIITNYESLKKLSPLLQAFSPQLVIADEAQAIKNHKAQRTKWVKSIKASYRLAMTGTPVANNPMDIWSIMDWVRPGLLGTNFYAFRNRHCIIYTGAGFPIIKGYLRMDELKAKVDRYSYRVLKQDCLDLPDKVFTKRIFDLGIEEARVYREMAEEMVADIGEEQVAATTILVKMLRLQQITSGFLATETGLKRPGNSKLMALMEVFDELPTEKIVVWAKFKQEIADIVEVLTKSGRPWYRLTGDETTEERAMAVKNFQELDDNAVIVGTQSAGGVGITLTAAHHCVYYSNSFSYTDRLQSQDRLHRIGQGDKVTYQDLVARGTVDSYILKVLEKKGTLADKITGDDLRKIVFDG